MQNKVVIVTGGSRGIGAGISKAFYEQGARVVINFHSNYHEAEKLLLEFGGSDKRLLLVQSDISSTQGRADLVMKTVRHFGAIDILVNNAGIAARGSFLKGTEKEFDAIVNTNLKAPIFLAQLCAKHMIEHQTKGAIVNIASISAHFPNAPTSYASTKAGLIAATKTMALKLGPHGIRVNAVTPGTIKSDMNRRVWQDNPDLWNEKTQYMPLGRGGEPHELANAVLYLASQKSSFITGTELVVDGGWMMRPYW